MFNRNNVKVSNSCMPNMENIINIHNKNIINPPKDSIIRTCNCIRKHQGPLNEKCLTNNVLYKASIKPNEENSKTKTYCGVIETAFNLRCMYLFLYLHLLIISDLLFSFLLRHGRHQVQKQIYASQL